MRSKLIVIHRSLGEAGAKPFSAVTNGAVWTTCLRSIAISATPAFAEQVLPSDQVFEGLAGYEFVLETVCGLMSPVKGETEVHGQFKKFMDEAKPIVPRAVFKALHQVHVDAKRIRTSCLRHLGSQSYGSFCRRHVRGIAQLNLIGSGHLVNELLPWLTKGTAAVKVFCRNSDSKRTPILTRSANVTVEELFHPTAELMGAMIIAAPVKSKELVAWFEKTRHNVELIIDLRAESAEDPLHGVGEVINLKSVFESIETSRARIDGEVDKARKMIKEMIYGNHSAAQNFSPQKRSGSAASVPSRTSA
jgi:glutamyl-tRNA reductase